jgi:hypothetical protein
MGLFGTVLAKHSAPVPPSPHRYGEPKPTPLQNPNVLARVLPCTDARPLSIEGRSYAPKSGAAQDVPLEDARILGRNGWLLVARSGAHSDRPELALRGELFLETGVEKLLQFDGRFWRDPITGAVV